LLLIINVHDDVVIFTLPECAGGCRWILLIDTNITEEIETRIFETGAEYDVTSHSLLLFGLESTP
jgi:glycogen operon protein